MCGSYQGHLERELGGNRTTPDHPRRRDLVAFLALTAGVPGCAHGPAPDARRAIRPDDPALSGSLTLAQSRALWGRSDHYSGPQWEYVDYPLEGSNSGRVLLWFQREAPHQLRRVLTVTSDEPGPVPQYQMILNLLPETESRTVEEIPSRRPLRVRDIARVWGPPDASYGSGVEIWVYHLADGRGAEMTVRYRPPGIVDSLRVLNADGIEWELNQ